MNNFKVGDRVRIAKHGNVAASASEIIGLEGVISQVTEYQGFLRVMPGAKDDWPPFWASLGLLMETSEIEKVSE